MIKTNSHNLVHENDHDTEKSIKTVSSPFRINLRTHFHIPKYVYTTAKYGSILYKYLIPALRTVNVDIFLLFLEVIVVKSYGHSCHKHFYIPKSDYIFLLQRVLQEKNSYF